MADETKLSLENAKWAGEQLGNFSPSEQNTLLKTEDFGEFEKILFDKGFRNSVGLWQGVIDLKTQLSQGVKVPISPGKTDNASAKPPSGAGAIGIAAGTAGLLLSKRQKYEDFKKRTNAYAEKVAKNWEEEEKKIQKKLPKKIDPNRPASRQEAYERTEAQMHDWSVIGDHKRAKKWATENPTDTPLAQALDREEIRRKNLTYQEFDSIRKSYIGRAANDWNNKPAAERATNTLRLQTHADREIHDHLILHSAEKAKQWARDYNDPALATAIERKRQQDERRAIENQGRISKALGRNPAAKFAAPALNPATTATQPNTTAWTPIPANTLPGTLPQNTLSGASSPNQLQNTQTQSMPPRRTRPFGIRSFARFLLRGPLPATTAAPHAPKNLNTLLRHNNLVRRKTASRVTSKLRKYMDASTFLQWLFKKAIIGSAISAMLTVVTSVIGLSVGIAVSAVITTVGIFSTTLTFFLGTIGLPLVIILVIIGIIIFVFAIQIPCLIFCDSEGGPIKESPYPGIIYFIVGPEQVDNGTNIKYELFVSYDAEKATAPSSNITLVADVPFGTTLVPGGTTGTYVESPAEKNVKWELVKNLPSSENGQVLTYQFTLTLNPDDDITVEVSISLLGAGAGGGGPPVVGGNCDGKYNSNNSEKGNFGDPGCDWNKNDAADKMVSLDPDNAPFWYLVAECESSHWPNAFNPSAKEATGAWGMYQMSYKKNPGPPYYNAGQVPWTTQTEEAFNRETKVAETPLYNNPFEYWECETSACQDAPAGMCTNGEYNVQGRTW